MNQNNLLLREHPVVSELFVYTNLNVHSHLYFNVFIRLLSKRLSLRTAFKCIYVKVNSSTIQSRIYLFRSWVTSTEGAYELWADHPQDDLLAVAASRTHPQRKTLTPPVHVSSHDLDIYAVCALSAPLTHRQNTRHQNTTYIHRVFPKDNRSNTGIPSPLQAGNIEPNLGP